MELLGDTLQIRHESMTMGISTCARVAMLGLAPPPVKFTLLRDSVWRSALIRGMVPRMCFCFADNCLGPGGCGSQSWTKQDWLVLA